MRFLLDTDTVSYSLRAHHSVIKSLSLHQESCAISAITTFELELGLAKNPRHTALVMEFQRAVQNLPFTDVIAKRSVTIMALLQKEGRGIAWADAFIAATALVHGLTLVTNNQKHYVGIDELVLANWVD